MIAPQRPNETNRGLRCPKCGRCEWEVERTTRLPGTILRRRKCRNDRCDGEIVTYERAAFE